MIGSAAADKICPAPYCNIDSAAREQDKTANVLLTYLVTFKMACLERLDCEMSPRARSDCRIQPCPYWKLIGGGQGHFLPRPLMNRLSSAPSIISTVLSPVPHADVFPCITASVSKCVVRRAFPRSPRGLLNVIIAKACHMPVMYCRPALLAAQ